MKQKATVAFLTCLTAAGALFGAVTSAQTSRPLPASPTGLCGALESSFGPFDYRSARRQDIDIVERFHFTPRVETLAAGESGSIGGDLDYTLRVFPNHPRALLSLVRLSEQARSPRIPGAKYPVECYFDRAIRFQPDDPQVRILYAYFLTRHQRMQEARRQLKAAESTDPTDPQILYNLGLGYADVKDYDRALEYAHRAYAAGITFSGLKDKLTRANRWRDATP